MRPRSITVLAAITALSAAGLFSKPAAAMPAANLAAATGAVSISQNVAWVCGPFRCWWAPRRYYAPVVVAPRVYYGYPAYYGYAPAYYGYGAMRRSTAGVTARASAIAWSVLAGMDIAAATTDGGRVTVHRSPKHDGAPFMRFHRAARPPG